MTVKKCTGEYTGGSGLLTVTANRGYTAKNSSKHNSLSGGQFSAGPQSSRVSGNVSRNTHPRLHGVNTTLNPLRSITGFDTSKTGNGAHIAKTPECTYIKVTTNQYAK